METRFTIPHRYKLSAILYTPDDLKPGEKRPAFIVLCGFGGTKDTPEHIAQAKLMCELGYCTVCFDMPGCGESEGERGRLILLEQADAAMSAFKFMADRPEVDSKRIGLYGDSLGAAVAVYTAGLHEEIAAVISCGGWGEGSRKFRKQHNSPEAWKKFTSLMEKGRRMRIETGETFMISRFDIVPIPEKLRKALSGGVIMEFPVDTVESMYNARPQDVVGFIAPRPLLLMHPADDSVTPTIESIELFKRAGQPTELFLLAGEDHFPLSGPSPTRAPHFIKTWLEKYFPLSM